MTYTRKFNKRERDFVEIEDVLCTRESSLALFCAVPIERTNPVTGKLEIENTESWIPKSQVDMGDSEVKTEGDEGILVVTRWFANKIGVPESAMTDH